MDNVFRFYTESNLPFLLGRKAKDPVELLEGIKQVPLSSIYYHTHNFLLGHHYMVSGPFNDFAYWITNILGMARMGERLASVDIMSFGTLEALRGELISNLSNEIAKTGRMTESPEGEEFYFMKTKSVVMPTPYAASTLTEFIELMGHVSASSIYFHVFEAPLRLGRRLNDFVLWLDGIGEKETAKKISALDPYAMTIEELRARIIRIGRQKYVRR